jgi:hypothetical protein
VFKEKFGEEFEHSRVVVRAQKYMAGAVLVGLNAFFIYYILLKGFQEGLKWQYQYLFVAWCSWRLTCCCSKRWSVLG